MASNGGSKRKPRLVQAGIDFGNAFSRAVLRDLDTNRAWVHQFWEKPGQWLIPGSLIFQDGKLLPHEDVSISYPDNGIWHLKKTLALLSSRVKTAEDEAFLSTCAQRLGPIFEASPKGVILAVCAFYLAGLIHDIMAGVKARYPDFEAGKGDYALLNMGIPDSCDAESAAACEEALRLGLCLAKHELFQPRGMDLGQVVELMQQFPDKSGNGELLNILCHVYPESRANAQAFCRAFREPQDQAAIWLITDAGACHVGQCAFCFSGFGDNPVFSFYAGQHCAAGSASFEQIASQSRPLGNPLEFWKNEKEGRDNFAAIKAGVLQKAADRLGKELEAASLNLYEGMQKNYAEAERERDSALMLKQNIRFIFIGGASRQPIYQDAVINSFNNFVKGLPGACFVAMPVGPDINLPSGELPQNFFTAYGLSFPFLALREALPES